MEPKIHFRVVTAKEAFWDAASAPPVFLRWLTAIINVRRVGQRGGRVSKEVVGIHVFLICPLSGEGTPHRLLPRVSPAKSTSAPLQF